MTGNNLQGQKRQSLIAINALMVQALNCEAKLGGNFSKEYDKKIEIILHREIEQVEIKPNEYKLQYVNYVGVRWQHEGKPYGNYVRLPDLHGGEENDTEA